MSAVVAFARLPTEQANPRSRALDRLSISQILRLMNREDAYVPRAVAQALPDAARAVALIVARLERGGRLFFLGAGTSGRLGVIEAAECPPTFNTPPAFVQAVMAGGSPAVFRSREGAEDDRVRVRREVHRRVRRGDAVVGIAASGVTPFVGEGLRAAHAVGAATILVTCSPPTVMSRGRGPDVVIAAAVGPEVIAGSTRLKAGTATKLILNMLTVASMVRLGKVYGNLMVDVRPTSRKLRARALRIVAQAAGVPPIRAAQALRASGGAVKPAIVMAARGVSRGEADARLARSRGRLRPILDARRAPRR